MLRTISGDSPLRGTSGWRMYGASRAQIRFGYTLLISKRYHNLLRKLSLTKKVKDEKNTMLHSVTVLLRTDIVQPAKRV
ncbi:hypothetical protein DXD57_06990 [Bacteroides intestinalis]|nr:hypothetical protein DXD57_06990 [Bacteroides intestinalis]